MIIGLAPCTAAEAVERMRAMVGVDMPYRLGSGDYAPKLGAGGVIDVPWTPDRHGMIGADCAGVAICYAYKLRRHRPGFNRGPWASVSDDINTNSSIEDAEHAKELFVEVAAGAPIAAGDLLMYPTIRLRGPDGDWLRNADGTIKEWIGHVQMVIEPNGARAHGPYAASMIAQCCGGEDRRPAVVIGHADHMDAWDQKWPKSEHRTRVIRVRSDIAIVG